jgi:hypothetical protein
MSIVSVNQLVFPQRVQGLGLLSGTHSTGIETNGIVGRYLGRPGAAPERAKKAVADLRNLTEEVTSESPRREWWQLSAKGIKEAAKAAGAIGKTVIDLLGKLLPLLGSMAYAPTRIEDSAEAITYSRRSAASQTRSQGQIDSVDPAQLRPSSHSRWESDRRAGYEMGTLTNEMVYVSCQVCAS